MKRKFGSRNPGNSKKNYSLRIRRGCFSIKIPRSTPASIRTRSLFSTLQSHEVRSESEILPHLHFPPLPHLSSLLLICFTFYDQLLPSLFVIYFAWGFIMDEHLIDQAASLRRIFSPGRSNSIYNTVNAHS